MRTKYFYYFQGLRVLKCHRTKRLNRVNYRLKWPLQKTFSSSTPPPSWISRVFDPPPPLLREFPESHPLGWGGGGGVDISGTTHFGQKHRSKGMFIICQLGRGGGGVVCWWMGKPSVTKTLYAPLDHIGKLSLPLSPPPPPC